MTGVRDTHQRRMTLEVLRSTKCHPTASELFGMLRQRLPRISLATVYRNLELLTRLGAIQKLDAGGGEARFDADLHPHQHVRCADCGRVADVSLPREQASNLGLDLSQLSEVSGYAVLGWRLDLIGRCPDCRIRGGTVGAVAETCFGHQAPLKPIGTGSVDVSDSLD